MEEQVLEFIEITLRYTFESETLERNYGICRFYSVCSLDDQDTLRTHDELLIGGVGSAKRG